MLFFEMLILLIKEFWFFKIKISWNSSISKPNLKQIWFKKKLWKPNIYLRKRNKLLLTLNYDNNKFLLKNLLNQNKFVNNLIKKKKIYIKKIILL